jgi:hypothetical protein
VLSTQAYGRATDRSLRNDKNGDDKPSVILFQHKDDAAQQA